MISLYNSAGTAIYSWSATDATAALQYPAQNGQTGFAINGNPFYTQLETLSDIAPTNATGYTISLGQSSGQCNLPIQGQVQLIGGNLLSAPIVITLVDSLGSTIAGSQITIPSGSNYGYFTYTPTAPGPHSISGTHTGGNAGMADSAPCAYTAAASGPLLAANNLAQATCSPMNWSPSVNNANGMQTWNPGAYIRFAPVSNCSSVNLLLDTASVGLFVYQIDEGPLNAAVGSGVGGLGVVNIPLPDLNAHYITVRHFSISQTVQRWTTAFFGVFGLLLPGGGIAGTAVANPKSMLMLGDSLWEGIKADNGTDGNPYDLTCYIGESGRRRSPAFEYGIIACGNLGYTVKGDSVPPVFVVGNDSGSWDKINANYSRLTNGLFSEQPDIIIIGHGANDSLHGTLGAPFQAAASGCWTAFRTAAPNAVICVVIPIGGYARVDLNAAFLSYQAAYAASNGGFADPKIFLIDLAIESRITDTAPGGYALIDFLHPQAWGHANIFSLLVPQIWQNYDNVISPPNKWVR